MGTSNAEDLSQFYMENGKEGPALFGKTCHTEQLQEDINDTICSN